LNLSRCFINYKNNYYYEKPTSHKYEKVCLEKEEDKDIARLLKAGSSLRQHPKHIAVKYYNTHRSTSHVIRNYSGAMIGILRSQPELNKYFSELVLLDQTYWKDDSKTIGTLVKEEMAKLGENIVVRRFARLELGVSED